MSFCPPRSDCIDVPSADLIAGADVLYSTIRRLIFGDKSQLLRHLDFHTAAIYSGLPVISGTINGAGLSPRRLSCDKLVEHRRRGVGFGGDPCHHFGGELLGTLIP